jgi:hypothetical protein
LGPKGPVACAEQDADGLVLPVADCEVKEAVVVKVSNRYSDRLTTNGVDHLSLERTVANTEENADRIASIVDNHQVFDSVTVKVGYRDTMRLTSHGRSSLGLESAVAIAE